MAARCAWIVLSLVLAACAAVPPPTEPPFPSPGPTATATPASPASPAPQPPTPRPTPTAELTATLEPAPTPEPTPTAPETTTISSPDGVVSIDIPHAALPPGIELAIAPRSAEDQPPELREAGLAQSFYSLLPHGTRFVERVRISQTYPLADFAQAGGIPLAFLAMRSERGTWQWLTDATLTVGADTVTISGTTDRFADLFLWSDRTHVLVTPPAPRKDVVGASFRRQVSLASRDDRPHPIAFMTDLVELVNHTPGVIQLGEELDDGQAGDWHCAGAGAYSVTLAGRLVNFARDNPFWRQSLGLTAMLGTVLIELTGECAPELVAIERLCVRAAQRQLGDFRAYLDWRLVLGPDDAHVERVEVFVTGANDSQPLWLQPIGRGLGGLLGMRQPGPKRIVSVLAERDGETLDITHQVVDRLGTETLDVRYPDQDEFGDC